METYKENYKSVRCQWHGEWKGGRKHGKSPKKTGDLRERPTTKNLAKMFVELEPVWEDPKEEQEDGKTEQHNSRHDTDGIPNLSSGRCYEAMERQTMKKQTSSECCIMGRRETKDNVHFTSGISEFNESERSKT